MDPADGARLIQAHQKQKRFADQNYENWQAEKNRADNLLIRVGRVQQLLLARESRAMSDLRLIDGPIDELGSVAVDLRDRAIDMLWEVHRVRVALCDSEESDWPAICLAAYELANQPAEEKSSLLMARRAVHRQALGPTPMPQVGDRVQLRTTKGGVVTTTAMRVVRVGSKYGYAVRQHARSNSTSIQFDLVEGWVAGGAAWRDGFRRVRTEAQWDDLDRRQMLRDEWDDLDMSRVPGDTVAGLIAAARAAGAR